MVHLDMYFVSEWYLGSDNGAESPIEFVPVLFLDEYFSAKW